MNFRTSCEIAFEVYFLINLHNISGARRCLALCDFVGEEAVVIPISLAEVPSLHWFTRYWGQEFCSSDE